MSSGFVTAAMVALLLAPTAAPKLAVIKSATGAHHTGMKTIDRVLSDIMVSAIGITLREGNLSAIRPVKGANRMFGIAIARNSSDTPIGPETSLSLSTTANVVRVDPIKLRPAAIPKKWIFSQGVVRISCVESDVVTRTTLRLGLTRPLVHANRVPPVWGQRCSVYP